MKRHFIYCLIALLTFLVGVALYLVMPVSHSLIKDTPHEAPIALVPNDQNKGQRCRAHTSYVSEPTRDIAAAIVNPFCADLQMKLIEAAASDDVLSARALLAQGANPNSPGLLAGEFYHALPQAASLSHVEMVQLLLDNGAEVNQAQCCCMSCMTALTSAIRAEKAETVNLLLARGANVHYKDRYDDHGTVLQVAEREGDYELLQLLDAAGAMSLRHRAERRLMGLLGKDMKAHRYIFPA